MIFFSGLKPGKATTLAVDGEKLNEESRPDPHLQFLGRKVTGLVPLGRCKPHPRSRHPFAQRQTGPGMRLLLAILLRTCRLSTTP